jgi:hypothetical protein
MLKELNMKKQDSLSMPRRTFIASGMLLGTGLFGMSFPAGSDILGSQEAKEALSSDEKEWVDSSTMAKDLGNYFGKGFSCAESLLMVSLRYLGKPEEWVWAAAGFGGGMYKRNLCGFLTAGVMSLGCGSSLLDMPRKEAKARCGEMVKDYWDWWESQAPYHCSQIRTQETTSTVCLNLGLLSAAKIEEMLAPIKNQS